MSDVVIDRLSYRYGGASDALHDISITAPCGAILGVLGSNGAGKTTLLQCCAGLRAPNAGQVLVGGVNATARALIVAGVIGYVAEGARLPADMTVRQLQRWLAPLHTRWDHEMAAALVDRFALDASRRVGTLSRGEYMKTALLCALAARPTVLLMDEPFTGMDVVVKDDILRGLLATAGASGTTVLIASHDIAEVESVLTHAVILTAGTLRAQGTMDQLRERYRRVTMVASDAALTAFAREQEWLEVERAGRVVRIVADGARTPMDTSILARRFPEAESITVEDLSLREIFSSVVRAARQAAQHSEAA